VSISSNYITLQRQIADECGDNQALLSPLSDSALTLSPIQNAIQSAIAKWEREPFYFNDLRVEPTNASPFKTVVAQEFYSSWDYAGLATIAAIKSVRVLIGNNRYPLNQRDSNYMNDVSINPTNTGQPVDYSFDANQMRFFPIPDAIYPVGLTGTLRLAALVNDTDANAWTQDAYDLIRCEAKIILAREVTYDEQIEANSKRAIYGTPGDPTERGYLYALKAETTRRHANRSKIRPTYF